MTKDGNCPFAAHAVAMSFIAATIACHRSGSDDPGVSRAETQSTEREEVFPLQAGLDVFLRVSCTSLDQESTTMFFEADAGVDDVKTRTTTNVQAAAREEFARTSKKRQQREKASTEQSKQFDPGG